MFVVEPAVISPGGTIFFTAQSLPSGAQVVFQVEGMADVKAPITDLGGGRYSATLPMFYVPIDAGPGGMPHVKLAKIVTADGVTVWVIGQTFQASASGFANDAPPVSPPAAPIPAHAVNPIKGVGIVVKKNPGTTYSGRMSGGGQAGPQPQDAVNPVKGVGVVIKIRNPASSAERVAGGGDLSSGSSGAWPVCAQKTRTKSNNANDRILPGETGLGLCPLSLETPAGPSLDFVLSYRSMVQSSSSPPLGNGWDHCFHVSALPLHDDPLNPDQLTRIAVYNGDGSVDVLQAAADGSFSARGLAVRGVVASQVLTLTFANHGRWVFNGFDASPRSGLLSQIIDPNGVTVTCAYAVSGQLSSVSSQFGQSLSFSYGPTGKLDTVTDHTGRVVSFSYFSGEPGGSAGDLQSVSCPVIPGQAAVQGPTTFTYSSGLTDTKLNGNLLTARDGAGRLICEWTYSSSTDPHSISYDRCVSMNVNGLQPGDPPVTFGYEVVPFNGVSFSGGLRCIENDELGRVCETVFDHNYCPVSECRYTTFATPGVPVTSSSNRPPAPTDGGPAFLQTTWSWNRDLCCSVCTEPDGTTTRTTYQSDLTPNCDTMERFNERVVTVSCKDNSQAPRTVTMEYLPGHGSCDRRLHQAEVLRAQALGNRAGQPGRKKGWDGVIMGSHKLTKADAGVCDDESIPLAGKVVSTGAIRGSIGINPGGRIRYECEEWRFRTSLTTSHGQKFTWNYDTNGNCLSSTTPIAGGGEVCTYNSLGQLNSVTTLNGTNPSYHDVCVYDPASRFRTSFICDHQENGGGLNLTTSCVRDALGRITVVTDERGFDSLISYNACDQPVSISSPVLGSSRVVCTQTYDMGGLPVRCDLENRDSSGAPVSANPAYTGFCVYDARGRLIQDATEQKPVDCPVGATSPDGLGLENFEVCDYTLDSAGQVTRWSMPAVCRGQSAAAVCDFQYNALGLCSAVIEGGVGNADAVTTEFSYNSSFQCSKIVCAAATGDSPTTTCDYDAWRRPATITDPMGNITSYTYNDYTGFVTESVYGEITDNPGSAGNVLLSKTQYKTGHVSLIKRGDDAASGRQYHRIRRRLDTAARSGAGMGDVDACRKERKDMLSWYTDRMMGGSSGSGGIVGATNERKRFHYKQLPVEICRMSEMVEQRLIGGSSGSGGLGNATNERKRFHYKQLPVEICRMSEMVEQRLMGGSSSGGDPFFDIFATDDIVIADRFDPWGQGSTGTETLTIHHTPVSQISSVSNNSDLLAVYGYDTAGRCVSLDLPTVEQRTDTLDAGGYVTSSVLLCRSTIAGTASETYTTTATYDAAGRCLSSGDSVGNTDLFAYDSMDRCVSHTCPNGLVIHNDYDTVSPTTGFSSVRQWCDYNNDNVPDQIFSSVILCGDCVSTADPLGYTTTFSFDALGRCNRCNYPDSTFGSRAFDSLGRATTVTRKDGAIITCDFDLNDRCVNRSIVNHPLVDLLVPVPPTTFQYDGLNRCVVAADNNSSVTWFRDSLGNVIEEDGADSVTHTYNHRGLLTTTYRDGTKYQYNRDAFGRVISFSSVVNNVIQQPAISVCDYSGFDCVQEVRADGVSTTFDYRSDGEGPLTLPNGVADFSFGECVRCVVTNSSNVIIGNYITRRNRDGEVVQVNSAFGNGQPQRRITFTRDNRDLITACLTQVRENASLPFSVESEVSYVLDARGKRVIASGGRNPGTYTSTPGSVSRYDLEMARYTTWPGGALRWNPEGSLEVLERNNNANATYLTYDALERLVESRDSLTGVVTSYSYDPIGRRLTSTTQGPAPATTYFIYDGDTCYQELDSTFNPTMTYAVCDGQQLSMTTSSGGVDYTHGARMVRKARAWIEAGAPNNRLITGNTGTVIERFDADDAGFPIFLNETGHVRGAATSSVINYRWLTNDCAWCPETSLFACPDSVYCPDLGQTVSERGMLVPIGATNPKKGYVGHVTLIR